MTADKIGRSHQPNTQAVMANSIAENIITTERPNATGSFDRQDRKLKFSLQADRVSARRRDAGS